jgi:hypothetical protein
MDGAGDISVTWHRQVALDTTLLPGDRGRVYTITATVTDDAGNVNSDCARLIVGRWARAGGLVEPTPPVIAGNSGTAVGPVG